MTLPDPAGAPAQGDTILVRSLRGVLSAQQDLTDELGGAAVDAARVAIRRQELVLRLKDYRAVLVRGGLSVPRSITDELRLQTHELAASTTLPRSTPY